jgi:hypothetical protein
MMGRPTRLIRSSGRVTLHVETFDGYATNVSFDDANNIVESQLAIRMEELRSALVEGDSLFAEFSNGSTSPLVGINRFHTSTGATTNWQMLYPADHPKSIGVHHVAPGVSG